MGRSLVYCHMCGMILSNDNNKQIIIKEVNSRKTEKLFDVCPECANRVSNLKFPMLILKPSQRKNPKFTSIIIKDFKSRKTKMAYDVLQHQLDYIKSLEIDINDLKLTYQDGKRLYTEFQVRKWMGLDKKNLISAMYLVYKHQTADEKKGRETKYSNSVGFNKPDASFMTGMSRIFEERGYDTYTDKQLKAIEKRMDKYVKQVTLFVNSGNMILRGI